jgi:Tfp pilus assembly protein PilV
MKKAHLQKGIGLVEVLVAASIFSVILGSLIVASNLYFRGASDSLKVAKAAYLAEEGIEAVKTMRDVSWENISDLSDGVDYYLVFNVSSTTNYVWELTTTETDIDYFTRVLNFTEVQRDIDGRIVSSGGTVDVNSRRLDVSIFWTTKSGIVTKTLTTYIASII